MNNKFDSWKNWETWLASEIVDELVNDWVLDVDHDDESLDYIKDAKAFSKLVMETTRNHLWDLSFSVAENHPYFHIYVHFHTIDFEQIYKEVYLYEVCKRYVDEDVIELIKSIRDHK